MKNNRTIRTAAILLLALLLLGCNSTPAPATYDALRTQMTEQEQKNYAKLAEDDLFDKIDTKAAPRYTDYAKTEKPPFKQPSQGETYVLTRKILQRGAVDDTAGEVTTYEYDESGALVREVGPDLTQTYAHDEQGRILSTVTYSGDAPDTDDDAYVEQYTYDDQGRVLQIQRVSYTDRVLLENTQYAYGENGVERYAWETYEDAMITHVRSVSLVEDGKTVQSFTVTDEVTTIRDYQYDEDGNCTRSTSRTTGRPEAVMQDHFYFYDEGVLMQEVIRHYQIDDYSAAQHQELTERIITYQYDEYGNLVCELYRLDGATYMKYIYEYKTVASEP